MEYSYPNDFFQLCYRGTNTPILLGDHVIYKEWFGLKKSAGRVSYIPGISPYRSDLADSEKSSLWGISITGGDFVQMLYVSDDKFISNKIEFVRSRSLGHSDSLRAPYPSHYASKSLEETSICL